MMALVSLIEFKPAVCPLQIFQPLGGRAWGWLLQSMPPCAGRVVHSFRKWPGLEILTRVCIYRGFKGFRGFSRDKSLIHKDFLLKPHALLRGFMGFQWGFSSVAALEVRP